MKILVVSDIHGSLTGVKRLGTIINRFKPDALLLLGDICHGAYDEDGYAVADAIKSLPVLTKVAVRGNCDYLMDADALGMDLPLSRDFSFGQRIIHMSHRPFFLREYVKGDIYVNGHTHCKALYEEGGAFFINPGSIALPRDDGASCALIDDNGISLIDVIDEKVVKNLCFSLLDI